MTKIEYDENEADQIFYDLVNAVCSHKVRESKLNKMSLKIAEKLKKDYRPLYISHQLILHEFLVDDNQDYRKLSDQIQDLIAELVKTYLY